MIQWYTKKQATIEGAVFGAEFVAMKTGVETLRGIRYKLRMMGVEIDGPTYVYGDNQSVITNKYIQARVNIEEDIKFNLLLLDKRGCYNEGVFDHSHSYSKKIC